MVCSLSNFRNNIKLNLGFLSQYILYNITSLKTMKHIQQIPYIKLYKLKYIICTNDTLYAHVGFGELTLPNPSQKGAVGVLGGEKSGKIGKLTDKCMKMRCWRGRLEKRPIIINTLVIFTSFCLNFYQPYNF